MEKKSDLGFHAYIRGIILIGFALLMLAFIITGNIIYYIAPTMMPFIYFATAVFLLLGVIQIIRSTNKGQEEEQLCDCGTDHNITGSPVTKLLIYSIFVAPIILGFVLPDKLLDSSVAANRGIQFGSGVLNDQAKAEQEKAESPSRAEAYLDDPDAYFDQLEAGTTDPEEHITADEYYTMEGFNQYYEELAEEVLEQGHIVVTEENYLDMMTMLDLQLERFIGKPIEIVGFVYREPEFEDNQLVVARFGMTCCVADASVYGTMIEANDAHQFENDTWVRVTGILDQTDYNEFRIPLIQLREIEIVEQPESPYVFPRFSF
ncbi:TIGR03943 family protein [Alkalihalobacillus sp. MEB130]|uniref:TIGR03943 family putative permease subunit n=1 Tax=Alkalihalobacillus sp. MEB130 TaxID=2976704 RepID=UPI0028DEF8BE|nr:TIGR03943 family protein [Alkalihalobacillus sp. MEB130]MDT8859850.1 TIGR03943 family protein [Alkalihalobacillus sp. MEB130]